jgi:hypothetical protein
MVRGIIDRGEVSETFALRKSNAALVLGETVVIPIALNNKLPTSGRVHGRGSTAFIPLPGHRGRGVLVYPCIPRFRHRLTLALINTAVVIVSLY